MTQVKMIVVMMNKINQKKVREKMKIIRIVTHIQSQRVKIKVQSKKALVNSKIDRLPIVQALREKNINLAQGLKNQKLRTHLNHRNRIPLSMKKRKMRVPHKKTLDRKSKRIMKLHQVEIVAMRKLSK